MVYPRTLSDRVLTIGLQHYCVRPNTVVTLDPAVPADFHARVNDLLKLRDRRDAATGALKKQLGGELAAAQRIFIKEVKMYLRKYEKQGRKRKPTAVEIPRLQLFTA